MADDRALAIALEAKLNRLDKNLGEAVNKLKAAGSKMEAAFNKTAAALDQKAATTAKGIGAHFASMGAGIKAGLAGLLTAGGLSQITSRVRDALSRLDDLGDTAARLGSSAGELVKFQQALNATGGDMNAFNESAEQFQGKIGAVIGQIGKTKATKDALAAIGISREEIANAGSLSDRLLLIADGISKVEDAAVRAAIADKLGIRPLLPLLEKGAAGVREITSRFTDMGREADDAVRKTGELADKLAQVESQLQTKEDSFFVQLAPAIIKVYGCYPPPYARDKSAVIAREALAIKPDVSALNAHDAALIDKVLDVVFPQLVLTDEYYNEILEKVKGKQ